MESKQIMIRYSQFPVPPMESSALAKPIVAEWVTYVYISVILLVVCVIVGCYRRRYHRIQRKVSFPVRDDYAAVRIDKPIEQVPYYRFGLHRKLADSWTVAYEEV